MKSVEEACCVVTVTESTDNERSRPALKSCSCSGVVLNFQDGIVICNSLVFSRFLRDKTANHEPNILLTNAFDDNMNVWVHYVGQDVNINKRDGEVPAMDRRSISHLKANLLFLVNCMQFQKAFLEIFNESDKWSFSGSDEESEITRDSRFLSWFAVLKVPGLVGQTHGVPVPWIKTTALEKGRPVLVCGSPFGSFCPDLFMSTLSKGIVSNLAGEENAVILTDARCLPGTEGGGLFIKEKDACHLVGLIVSPLCWKSGDWIGLTLVCSLHLILRNMVEALDNHEPHRKVGVQPPTDVAVQSRPSTIVNYPTVILVESGLLWGSGVMLNSRIALTCRHVVNGKSRLTVRFGTTGRAHATVGKVLYSSKESSPYDVAVVQLEEPIPYVREPELASSFLPGDDVVVIGYGAFGQKCGPSMCSGILSRAIACHSTPVMLQTTCAVQSGASGGAVVRTVTGELLGLVSSNTRDFAAKVTYPHLNFSIPVSVLEPVLQVFGQTGDASVFRTLDTADDSVRRVWRLQTSPSRL